MRPGAIILTLLIALLPLCGNAAEQGKLGPESSANFTITLTIQPSIQIKTVSDIALTISNRKVDASFSKPFCVQGSAHAKYTVVAYGSSQDPNEFVLHNADNDKLPYHVAYHGDPASGSFDPLSPGVPSRSYSVLDRGTSCDNKTAFRVTFRSVDLQNAGSGLYTGALTLMVSPV